MNDDYYSLDIFDIGPIQYQKAQLINQLSSLKIIYNKIILPKTLIKSPFLYFYLIIKFLLIRFKFKNIIIFNHECLAFARLYNFKKIVFYNLENPYKVKFNKLLKTLIFLRKKKSFEIIISTDPYRSKFNRRYYKIHHSFFLPNITLKLDTQFNIQKKSDLVIYSGRIADDWVVEKLYSLKQIFKENFIITGKILYSYLDSNLIKKIKNKKFSFFYENKNDYYDILTSCNVGIYFCKRNKNDIGTKYQTPHKVWEYLSFGLKILIPNSPSSFFYFKNLPFVDYYNENDDIQLIKNKITSLSKTKIEEDQYKSFISYWKKYYIQTTLELEKILNV